jgi:hypothetical protein
MITGAGVTFTTGAGRLIITGVGAGAGGRGVGTNTGSEVLKQSSNETPAFFAYLFEIFTLQAASRSPTLSNERAVSRMAQFSSILPPLMEKPNAVD